VFSPARVGREPTADAPQQNDPSAHPSLKIADRAPAVQIGGSGNVKPEEISRSVKEHRIDTDPIAQMCR
jgi:hypothetical protein